jgi:hypothetical protein
LERRATEEPSIHRELLLASKHALLVILDYPRSSSKFETLYDFHIKQAKAMLEGRPVEETIPYGPVDPVPLPASELPKAAPTTDGVPGSQP